MSSWLPSWSKRKDEREFEVMIYEEDYKELCAFVLRKPNIETGGDLFGLWADDYKAVIQLALGPGKGRRRTSTSFYQDVKYLENVGSYLTENEGVCHIGEWHSHHQLGLARPSGGDENTVWNNMPTYNLSRFVIFIANIDASKQTYTVNIGCFLFQIDTDKGNRLPVKEGKFKILHAENPFSQKKEVKKKRSEGAEQEGGDEGNVYIKDLKLVEREGDRPYVTFKRPIKRTLRNDDYQPKPKKNKSQNQTTIRGEDDEETADPGNGVSGDLSQEIQQKRSNQEDSDTSHEEAANEKPGEGTAGAPEAAEKDKNDGEAGKKENKREKEMMGKGSMGKEKDDGQDGKEGNKRKNERMGEGSMGKEKDDGQDGKEGNKRENEMMGEGSVGKEKDAGQGGKEENKSENEMMGEGSKETEQEEEEENQQKMKEKQECHDKVDEKKSQEDDSKEKEPEEARGDEVQPGQGQVNPAKSVSTEEAQNEQEQQKSTECQGSQQGQESPEKKATSKGEQTSEGKSAASAPAREKSTAVSGVRQGATTSATGKSKNEDQTKKKGNVKAEKAKQPTKGKKDASKVPGKAKKTK